MANQTIEATVVVEGVNPKASEQYKTAGGLKTPDGWINVAEGVDMSKFRAGGKYKVLREVLENGSPKNVIEIVETLEEGKAFNGKKPFFKQNTKGQRAGGIGHDAANLGAAIITTNGKKISVDDAIELHRELALKMVPVLDEVESSLK